jgi:hypothetical protein
MFPSYIPTEIIKSNSTKYWMKNIRPKNIPVQEFCEKVEEKIENIPVIRFKNSFVLKINNLLKTLINSKNKSSPAYAGFICLINDFKTQIEDDKVLSDFKIVKELSFSFKSGDYNKVIKIQVGTSIYKAYSYILENVKKYLNETSESIDCPEYNLFLKRKSENEELYLVHSKNILDILMMSSRSYWKSCQYLFDNKSTMRFKTINSACDPEVSIVYLTNKKDFKSFGEEYIARCLLSVIRSKYTDEEYVLVSNYYGNVDIEQFNRIVVDKLSKYTNKKVLYQYNPSDHNIAPRNNFHLYDYYRFADAEYKYDDLVLREYFSDVKDESLNICLRNSSYLNKISDYSIIFINNDQLKTLSDSNRKRYFKNKIKSNDLSEKFIEFYEKDMDWDLISEYQYLNLNFVKKHFDKLNFDKISKNKNIINHIVEAFPDRFPEEIKLTRLQYSEEQLSKILTKENVGVAFRNQKMSYEFIKNNDIVMEFLNSIKNKQIYLAKYQKHLGG